MWGGSVRKRLAGTGGPKVHNQENLSAIQTSWGVNPDLGIRLQRTPLLPRLRKPPSSSEAIKQKQRVTYVLKIMNQDTLSFKTSYRFPSGQHVSRARGPSKSFTPTHPGGRGCPTGPEEGAELGPQPRRPGVGAGNHAPFYRRVGGLLRAAWLREGRIWGWNPGTPVGRHAARLEGGY